VTRAAVLLVFAVSLLAFSAGSDDLRAQPAAPPKADPKKGGFEGRTKEGKARLLKEFGGSVEGEEAVMLGLAWLVQVQKQAGNWEYDGGHHRTDHAAATGMAVLAFTGAGQSHKEGRYKQTVQAGVDWLLANVDMSQGPERGKFRTITNMYSQGIASLALIEAYGMTRDPALRGTAQAVVDYIQKAQGPRGSWGYTARTDNDTSIVGWQIQALHAAQLTQDLVVDPKVIEKAIGFLDFVSGGRRGQQNNRSTYGYSGPPGQPATSLTAIGLLCRYYVDGWRAETPGFAEGAKGLTRRTLTPVTGRQVDLYYYYYATQVVRFYGGEEWKTWNEGPAGSDGKRSGGLADVLLNLQVRTPTNRGSWNQQIDPNGLSFGPQCGRLGTTCMCLLTLEVYYRYTPETEKDKTAKELKP
jgi:hypothetical protein